VTQQFYAAVEACQEDDTFVCYFSGHGFLDKGALFLLWNDSHLDRLLTTALPVQTIALGVQRCPAQNKLLILDCCHAGAVAAVAGFKDAVGMPVEELGITPHNHIILMAAERLERAREYDELKGSYLTNKLCAALDRSFESADIDGDGLLSIADLKLFLEAQTSEFNLYWHSFGKVPTPYFLGQQKGAFFLTKALSEWTPYEITWPDGSQMIVLPIRPTNGQAVCLAKHPIRNAQYQRFIAANPTDFNRLELYKEFAAKFPYASGHLMYYYDHKREPLFEEFLDPLAVPCQVPAGVHYYGPSLGQLAQAEVRDRVAAQWWKGPFYPWQERGFREPDKPVVCITVREAAKYCAWVDKELLPPGTTYLPSTVLWDFAAFGKPFAVHSPDAWPKRKGTNASSGGPPAVGASDCGTNKRGFSDLFQTVWQWCLAPIPMHTHSARDVLAKLRGGSYLSDLTREEPYWDAAYLDDYEETRRSDIGFRIAGSIRADLLPHDVNDKLSVCPPVSDILKFHW
jgi:formylglycine-generating enzyme required for sulfatase activity